MSLSRPWVWQLGQTYDVSSLDGCRAQDLISKIGRSYIDQRFEVLRYVDKPSYPDRATINGIGKRSIGDVAIPIANIVGHRYGSVRSPMAGSGALIDN